MENFSFRHGGHFPGKLRPISFNSYGRSTSIVKNSCCQEDAPLLNFSVESAEN